MLRDEPLITMGVGVGQKRGKNSERLKEKKAKAKGPGKEKKSLSASGATLVVPGADDTSEGKKKRNENLCSGTPPHND